MGRTFLLYEDDGRSFEYRNGAWMRIEMSWLDAERRLALRLAPGSRMLPPLRREIVVRVAGEKATRDVTFDGSPVEMTF